MKESFVEYLKISNLFSSEERENNIHPTPISDAQIIQNLSGFKISSLENLSEKIKATIIDVLESHLDAHRKKASSGSSQYNSNLHISLLQALTALRSKKTQP